ncbi:MAG: glutamine amidotransferase, partial [Pseudomonadota bacterium]|nr:glutamine amidotransferase [Pseudomonadota bacterium]
MPDTVLLIVHQKKSVPGHIGHLFKERGYKFDRRCPCLGDELPEELEAYAAVAIFGGPMSANDCWMPGIKAELDFVPKVLEAKIPFLGLCLGGQILARVLGADVRPHADGHIESGYTRIYPTEAGREWFAESDIFYQWHREGFDTPSTATLIAKGDIFPNQAFVYNKSAIATQFHPEITREMIDRWTMHGAHRLNRPGA